MFSLLLAIIYLAFISLGLPDSLLGSAWPVMHVELGVPVSYAGAVSMIISVSTIVSSLFSDILTRKLGTGLVTAISVLLTAGALFGFSMSNAFWLLCVIAVPYGLGAGAVDAALNTYVAVHCASKHMSWLHCFWGVGASISPYIMGYALGAGHGWRAGYGIVSVIQLVLTVVLFVTLFLWKRARPSSAQEEQTPEQSEKVGLRAALTRKGVPFVLLAFFGYCAFESTAGMWASTYLVQFRHVSSELAATFASLFYIGITAGRFVCGFVADKVGDKNMIRIGVGVMLVGVLLVLLPVGSFVPALVGLVVTGLGCAPVYPSIIHSTPNNFGKENAQAIVGIQMASAYTGSLLMPTLFGVIAEHVHVGLYPVYLCIFGALVLVMSELLNRAVRRPQPKESADGAA